MWDFSETLLTSGPGKQLLLFQEWCLAEWVGLDCVAVGRGYPLSIL